MVEIIAFIFFLGFIYLHIITPLLIVFCPSYRKRIEKRTKQFYDKLT